METNQNNGEPTRENQSFQSPGHLTEEDVKRVALRYLKGYYKYRPSLLARPLEGGGYIDAKLGVRTESGIIADGYLSYFNADGEPFVATFEATSYLTRDELRYKYMRWMLFWDSLAAAAVFTALLFGYVFISKWYSIRETGLLLNSAGLATVLLLLMAVYWLLLQHIHRYRYIYAIEQFKQYHANEQWIAVAEDAFEIVRDKYFSEAKQEYVNQEGMSSANRANMRYVKELKQQCVRNGFGLLFVDKEFKAQLSITPARRELFGSSRAAVSFVSKNDFAERLMNNRYTQKIKETLNERTSQFIPAQVRSIHLFRYRRSYFFQIAIFCMAIAVIAAIFVKEWQRNDIIIYGEGEYEKIIKNLDLGLPEDPESVVTNPLDIQHIQPFLDVNASYLENPDIVLWRTPSDRYQPYLPPPNQFIRVDSLQNTMDGLYITSKGEITSQYSCAELRAIKGSNFIIQDSFQPSLEKAVERINELGFYGFSSNVLSLKCFRNNSDRYVVFLDFLYSDRQMALIKMNQYQKWLKSSGLYEYELMLRAWKDL